MNRGYERSRYNQRSKRKKNLLLNSLIGVVILLIIIVGASIFLGQDDDDELVEEDIATEEGAAEEPKVSESQQPTSTESETPSEIEEIEEEPSEIEANSNPIETNPQDEGNAEEETNDDEQEEHVIHSYADPNWKPVGTVQEGEHYNVYDGVDWDEMVKAITYAVGLSEDEITIHFLGNNGPNKSVGTIYTKNKENIYRVYIEWIDQQGWKPTLVEELADIVEEDEESIGNEV